MANRPLTLDLDRLAPHLTNRRLRLILLPTEACNFRCVYCYETFQYKRMESWIVEGVQRLLDRRAPGLDHLELSWFGGEPLLAVDIIETILLHVRDLKPSVAHFSSDITTNAYLLTTKLFQKLLALGVSSYQISFDGPRAYHDRKRVMAGGKGTFNRVWENTIALRDQKGDFRVLVRVHADRDNTGAIPEFIRLYEQELGSDHRFSLFVRPLSRLGGPNDHQLAVFDKRESKRATEALRRFADEMGLQQRDHNDGPAICYAASANSFVIRANGRINKCTVALEHPNNQIGFIRPDGTLQFDMPKAKAWMRGLRSGDEAELACPMMGWAEPVPRARVLEDVSLTVSSRGERV